MSTDTAAFKPPAPVTADRRTARRVGLVIVSKYGTLIAMAIMLLIFGLAVPNGAFLSGNNLLSIVNQSALTAIIACGLTLVLVVGEMDLSIGYSASLAGVLVTGLMANQGVPLPVAILLTLAAGAIIGAVNGLLVTKAGVNAVVATLGVGTILIGLSFGYTSGSPIVSVPTEFAYLTLSRFAGIQNPIWFMLIVLAVLWLVLNRTAVGSADAGRRCQQECRPAGRCPHRSRENLCVCDWRACARRSPACFWRPYSAAAP